MHSKKIKHQNGCISNAPSVWKRFEHAQQTNIKINAWRVGWNRKAITNPMRTPKTKNVTIPTDIITTARVHLRTTRAGDAMEHSN